MSVARRARRELADRGVEDGRVLAHLHLRQMEPERLRLPPQVLQLAPCERRGAAGVERSLQHVEVRDVLRRVVVGASPARARGGEAMGGESELPPMRGVGQLAGEFPCGAGERAFVPHECSPQRRRWPHVAIAHRERARDAPSRALQAAQHVIGRDRRRRLRGLGRDRRVPVAVAADPCAPSEERGERRFPHAAALGVERAVDLAVDERKRREDRLVEQGERRPDLVERLRPMVTDRVGPPQAGDLLSQPPRRLRRLRSTESTVVEVVEQRRRCATRVPRRRGASPRSGARSARDGCAHHRTPSGEASEPSAAIEPSTGRGPCVRARSTRMRWRSSARFTSWK